MPYYTGTITGGGAAGLIDKLEECLELDTVNYTFVEEVTVSSKAYRIWKQNGHAWNDDAEFFFYLQATTGTFYARPFEEWNATTKKCTGLLTVATSGSSTLDSLGRLAAQDPAVSSNGGIYLGSIPTTESTYTYYIGLGPQGIHMYTSMTTDGGYIGLYEPSGLYASGEFPLCGIQYTNSGQSKVTRMPGLTGSLSYNIFNATVANDAVGGIPTGLTQLGGKSVLARRRVIDYNNVVRGLLPPWVLASGTPNGGVTSGDYITIDGVTYTLAGSVYGWNWIASNA